MLKLVKYNPKEFAVKNAPDNKIEKSVQKIIGNVCRFGDKAVLSYAKEFDGFNGRSIKVKNEEIENALKTIDKNIFHIFKRAKMQME
jgi:histidinol dehydrogenase